MSYVTRLQRVWQWPVSLFEIAKMLGHTSSIVTERVYAKHSPGFLRSAADKLG